MSRWTRFVLVLAILLVQADAARAQTPAQPRPPEGAPAPPTTMLLTVFLKHDQAKTLNEINEQLFRNGYYDKFPPEGIEVVSWYVVMGIGQVVTLRLPPERLREVNVVLEQTAWGAYRTEFYPTYDYKSVGLGEHEKAR